MEQQNHNHSRYRSYYRILLYGLIALLAWVPLPVGSNLPLYWHLMAVVLSLLFLFWLVGIRKNKDGRFLGFWRVWYISIPYLLCVAWVIVQIIAPRSSPHPLWYPLMVALNTGEPLLTRISICPESTFEGLIRYLTYGMGFWIAMQLSHFSSTYAARILKSLAFIGVAYAFYGLFAFSLGKTHGAALFPHDVFPGYVTSTFVGRTNYASYTGMIMLVSLSVILIDIVRMIKIQQIHTVGQIVTYVLSHRLPYFGFAIILFAGGVMTFSRAGLIFIIIGLLVLLSLPTLSSNFKRFRKLALLFFFVGMISFAIFLNFAGKSTFDRMMTTSTDLLKRQVIYLTTIQAFHQYEGTGSGLGTFEFAYQPHITEEYVIPDVITEAHNTYLENLLELGLVGFALLMSGFVAMHVFFLLNIFSGHVKDTYAMLAVAVSTQLGGHALFDFSFQIPAIMLTYAVVLGVCLGQLHKRSKLEHHE
jgi:hypothetical protein